MMTGRAFALHAKVEGCTLLHSVLGANFRQHVSLQGVFSSCQQEIMMSILRIENPSHITLPKEIGERLRLKPGDVVLLKIEAGRVILEKPKSSPVDDSFGIWKTAPDGTEYVNTLRDEWEERLNERLNNA
jgi:AbrB family looped-hinge helix DNA binding protein